MEFAASVLLVIRDLALAPFEAFWQGRSIIRWPYLLSAGVLAVGLAAIAAPRRPGGLREALRTVFSARIWWSPSTRADYRYYFVNAILFPLIFSTAIIGSFAVGGEVRGGLDAALGPLPAPLMGETAARVAYTVLFFIAYDFGRFLAHWLQHQVPLLWEFHKVHHSAEALTPITSFRLHPVDLLVMAWGGNLFGGLMTGLFLYIGGGAVSAYTVLGAHAGIAVYNLIGNLRHSHVWLDYGRLGYIFISPAQHQIHHSKLERHWGRNCGFALAVWDAMFGTLYVPKGREDFPMGLGDGTDGTWHRVWCMYWRPVRLAARLLRGRVAPTAEGAPHRE